MFTNLLGGIVLFIRSIILARLLPVEVFGIYAFATAAVSLSSMLSDFGLGSAFVHRSPETEDEEQAAAVHFTLKCLLTLIWAMALLISSLVLFEGQTLAAFLLITITASATNLTSTPRVILIRRVVHRRLALMRLLTSVTSSLVAVGLAWYGFALGALLASNVVSAVLSVVGLYIWRPVWRPRLTWQPQSVRYFFRFGSRISIASLLAQALDRLDDVWVGSFLGATPLGYYSRAYTFAIYPRRILAIPMNAVAGGTFAELKSDRHRLSQAFFRVNAFLVRSGFFLGGLMTLIAPEFIRLVLGEKWLPMLNILRLMLVFTLLDPMKGTIANLIAGAVGNPEQVVKARTIQLAVLVGGMLALGSCLGIVGIALAVDIMLVVGILILLWYARNYVDFSMKSLFAVPSLALFLGILLADGAVICSGLTGNDWLTGVTKAMSFTSVFGAVLLLLEREQFSKMLSLVRSSMQSRQAS
jgi:O-antigen/teichoic acid export membrane protein